MGDLVLGVYAEISPIIGRLKCFDRSNTAPTPLQLIGQHFQCAVSFALVLPGGSPWYDRHPSDNPTDRHISPFIQWRQIKFTVKGTLILEVRVLDLFSPKARQREEAQLCYYYVITMIGGGRRVKWYYVLLGTERFRCHFACLIGSGMVLTSREGKQSLTPIEDT